MQIEAQLAEMTVNFELDKEQWKELKQRMERKMAKQEAQMGQLRIKYEKSYGEMEGVEEGRNRLFWIFDSADYVGKLIL